MSNVSVKEHGLYIQYPLEVKKVKVKRCIQFNEIFDVPKR